MQLRHQWQRRGFLEWPSSHRTHRAAPPPQEVGRDPTLSGLARNRSEAADRLRASRRVPARRNCSRHSADSRSRGAGERREELRGEPAPERVAGIRNDRWTRPVTLELARQRDPGGSRISTNTISDCHQCARAALSGGDATSSARTSCPCGRCASCPAAAGAHRRESRWTRLRTCGQHADLCRRGRALS